MKFEKKTKAMSIKSALRSIESRLLYKLSNPYLTIVLAILVAYLLYYPVNLSSRSIPSGTNRSELQQIGNQQIESRKDTNCAKWNFLEEVKYMDKLALDAGTVKASTFANYTRIYPLYFAPLKDEPIRLLEIGIFKGQSVRLWENYFSKAELHFIDLPGHKRLIEYWSKRSKYHFMNQTHVDPLTELAKTTGPFDVIIDDAGHLMEEQILSFKTLFPYVKPGGIYVIEDIFTSYWKEKGGLGSRDAPKPGPGTTIDFVKNLVDQVNFVSASFGFEIAGTEAEARLGSRMSYYSRRINSVHFYDGIVIILAK